MANPRLANRYAKSLIDLAVEKEQLETVYLDVQYLHKVCEISTAFVNVLVSPIIRSDKKQQILDAITANKTSVFINTFYKLLLTKGRESILPEILEAFIDQYNYIKGIHKVKLTTALPISDATKAALSQKISSEAGLSQIELHLAVQESIIGGFILEFDNKLVDASIAHELKQIKKQFSDNAYVHKLR